MLQGRVYAWNTVKFRFSALRLLRCSYIEYNLEIIIVVNDSDRLRSGQAIAMMKDAAQKHQRQ